MKINFMKFNGDNWEDMLYFLKDNGDYITTYNSKDKIFESHIYIRELFVQVNIGDVVAYIDDAVVVFNKKDWKRYNRPKSLIEFERVLNIVFPIAEVGTNITEIASKITGYDFKAGELSFILNTLWCWIDGIECNIIEVNDDKFEVELKNDSV